jgi:hypothetical protein
VSTTTARAAVAVPSAQEERSRAGAARAAGTGPERPLRVEDRESLGRDSGVALVRAGTDRLLVGWGRDGVRLVARLGVDGGRP